MIVGPLAFRSNAWRRTNAGFTFVSPAWCFEWEKGWVKADCGSCPRLEEPHPFAGWIDIRKEHSCGIYATLTERVIQEYLRESSVVMLVEALGPTWLCDGFNEYNGAWEAGFTASGAQIVYLIDYHNDLLDGHNESNRSLALIAAATKYHVPVISFKDALAIARIQWEKWGGVWKGEMLEDVDNNTG